MTRFQKTVVWMVIIGFLLGGVGLFAFRRFSPPQRGSAEEVVLRVEGQSFTRQQFLTTRENVLNYYRQLYQLFGQDLDALMRGTDGAFRLLSYIAQAAEGLIYQAIITKEASRLRVTVPKAELDLAVQESYNQVLQQFGGDENKLAAYLSQNLNLTLDQYKDQLRLSREQSLKEEKLKATVVGAIEPTEAQLLSYYEANKDRYQSEPEKIRVAYILVDDAKLADELLGKAQSPGADFASLAREFSQDEATKEKGGETDFFGRYDSPLSTKVTDAVWNMNPGEVKLVADEQGYYIVRFLERKASVVPALSAIVDQVRNDYVQEETANRWNAWYQDKRAKANITVEDPVIHAALLYSQGDKQAALEKLLAAEEKGYALDPYLPYYIGRIYEELYTAASTRKGELEGKEGRTPEEEAELSQVTQSVEDLKKKALASYLEFMDTGEGDEAFFNRVLLLDPQNTSVHYQLAERYRQSGLYTQADAEYAKILGIDPKSVPALIGRGDNAMALGLYGRAGEFYTQALALQPGSSALKLKLADAYVKNGQYEEAQPLLNALIAADPENADALSIMADLLLAQGKAAEAADYYKRAWTKRPTVDIQLRYAQALSQAGKATEAIREYRDILSRSPYNAQAHFGYAELLLAQGKKEEALKEYQDALRFAGDVTMREQAARKIVELNPTDISTRFRLANYLREQYKYDAAIAQYQAILEIDPESYDAVVGLGDCYVPKVQYDKALEYYNRALTMAKTSQQKVSIYTKIIASEEQRAGRNPLGPEGLEALWQRALLYKGLGQTQSAVDDLKRIQSVDSAFRAAEVQALLAELTAAQPQ